MDRVRGGQARERPILVVRTNLHSDDLAVLPELGLDTQLAQVRDIINNISIENSPILNYFNQKSKWQLFIHEMRNDCVWRLYNFSNQELMNL